MVGQEESQDGSYSLQDSQPLTCSCSRCVYVGLGPVQFLVNAAVTKKPRRGGGKGAVGTAKDDGADTDGAFEDTPDRLETEDGKHSDLKITSWNVDGLRAWVRKNGVQWVTSESPDIMCLQETKCSEKQVPAEVKELPEFPHQYWSSPQDKEGYSGVGMLCKVKPLNVTFGI
eukprot:g40627.t1